MAELLDDGFGYVRVSTKKQQDEGDSIDAQAKLLTVAMPAAGYRIVDIIVEGGRSGESLKRKELQRTLARMRAGEARALWVTKLDRLTRRPMDLEFLLERHFGDGAPHVLKIAKEPHDAKTAVGRLTLRILVAIAQHELDNDSERTLSIVEHRRSAGKAVGPTPLGFTRPPRPHDKPCDCSACEAADDAPLLISEHEQAAIRRIRELKAEGLGPRPIARTLTDEGYQTKRGGQWRGGTVAKLIARILEAKI